MSKKILTTPIAPEDLADIKIGDVIYLTGHIVTCRDVPHRRVVQEGRELPLDIAGGAILHAGPIIRKTGEKSFEMVSVGPTTSMRMEKFEREFIAKTGVRLIVGKGGMGEGTMSGCKEFGHHARGPQARPAQPRAGRADRKRGLDGAWDARDAVEVPREGVWSANRLDRRARK